MRFKASSMDSTIETSELLNSAICSQDRKDPGGQADAFPVQPKCQWYFIFKAIFDFLAALVLLILTFPVMLIAGIVVKLTSQGPILYSQTRLGKDGREFKMFKLRTMIQDAESGTGAVWAVANDPRITPFGKFLRRSHIDEFPQLMNVLLGQMSLVGPRPERPEFADELEGELPHYYNRLLVRPGITGVAQLNLPPDSDIDGVRKKLVHDLYYVHNVNPWLDFKILASTAFDFTKTAFK